MEIIAFVLGIVALVQVSEVRKEMKRLRRDVQTGGGSDRELELIDEVERLRAELTDVLERMEYTERMLTRARREEEGPA